MNGILTFFDNLFESGIEWLFATKTRVFEVFNATLFMSWGIAAIVDPRMFETSTYWAFGILPLSLTAAAFFAMSLMSIVGIFSHKINARFLGGYSLFLSSLVWALVSVGFVAAYPPLTTAMVLYPQLSLLCFVVGRKIINECAKKGT